MDNNAVLMSKDESIPELYVKVDVKLTDHYLDLIEEFTIESQKHPDTFRLWHDSLTEEKRDFLYGLCLAAQMGHNKHLFDMSSFEKHRLDIDQELGEC